MTDTGPVKVTRVVVVRPGQMEIECWADSWEVCLQDDGRTIKLFADGDGMAARAERNKSLSQELL